MPSPANTGSSYDTITHAIVRRSSLLALPIINFGSCCIDHVYSVEHFVKPGETLPCLQYEIHPGGKGLNQSIALARAGADVIHAGRIGTDGVWLAELMRQQGIDTRLLKEDDGPTGHASIQVSGQGENAILLFGGANRRIGQSDVDEVLARAQTGQLLLLQNEISALEYLVEQSLGKGLRIALNAAPMASNILGLPLEKFEVLIINEVEGEALAGESEPDAMLRVLRSQLPDTRVVLTLGEEGALFQHGDSLIRQQVESVAVVDSTGAGDTFTGYFLASYNRNEDISACLTRAIRAAAISVTRKGAASSIPEFRELDSKV